MSHYGPPIPHSFHRLLRRVGERVPDRDLLEAILDEMVDASGAERAFLFRARMGGGFRVLLARNGDREPIAEPGGRISHYAVGRALETGSSYFVEDSRRDRRYRTEESMRTRRQPISLLVLPLRIREGVQGGVYLDHRFQTLGVAEGVLDAIDLWRGLMEVSLQARERERLLSRAQPARRAAARVASTRAANTRGVDHLPGAPPLVVEFHELIAASPDMLDLCDAARRLGRTDLPVVLYGETGTGKEVLARAIHRSSPRAERPFLAVNCGGFPDALLESELFGHARGAFTGADVDRTGLLLQADGGTVLLDEVGDMSPQMQQKLLHVLEDGRVRPLGHKTAVRIDVRILSSTHRDLEKLVEEGRFRKDLFYRLRGTTLSLPPLRDRREEILLLAERFLERFARADGREPPRLGESARRRLVRYSWPGNIRELENEIRRMAGLDLEVVEEKHLSPFVRGGEERLSPDGDDLGGLRIEQVVSEAERGAIRKALERSGGNKSRAAALLGITRKALYRRMARYGMRW